MVAVECHRWSFRDEELGPEEAIGAQSNQCELDSKVELEKDDNDSPASANKVGFIERCLPAKIGAYGKGWRGTIVAFSFATTLIILINICFLGWAMTQPIEDGTRIIFEGDCTRSKSIDTWLHFGINLMSTIVLAASNYSMQIIIAPTRDLIDQANSRGTYLDVGRSSLRNFSAVPGRQKLLWFLLLIASLPLHLLWNSVIISTGQAVNYNVTAVSQDFMDASLPDSTFLGNISEALDLQYRARTMSKLSTAECLNAMKPLLESNIATFVLITNITHVASSANYPILWEMAYNVAEIGTRNLWFCGATGGIYEFDGHLVDQSACLLSGPDPTDWVIPYTMNSSAPVGPGTEVEYCLVEGIAETCTVQVLPTFFYIVLAFNFIKLAAFWGVMVSRSQPILTLGDAIGSFLESPLIITNAEQQNSYELRKHRTGIYLRSVGVVRVILTFLFIMAYASGLILLIAAAQFGEQNFGIALDYWFGAGFMAADPTAVGSLSEDPSGIDNIMVSALMANIPQLALSILYVSYNSIWTSMMIAKEWVAYATTSKGLRTLQPQGKQRSTYFLSLPLRYSIPMLVISVLLHWLMSLSLFSTQSKVYNADGELATDDVAATDLNGIGWSRSSAILALIAVSILLFALVFMGFRRYPKTLPMVGSNSLLISSYCRPLKEGESKRKLQFGTVKLDDGYRDTFSSGPVVPLVPAKEPGLRQLLGSMRGALGCFKSTKRSKTTADCGEVGLLD